MAEVLLNAQILLSSLTNTTSIDLAPFTGEFSWSVDVEMVKNDNFAALGYKSIVPGLCSGMAGTKGAADYAAGGVSVTLNTVHAREAFAHGIIIGGVNAVAGGAALFTRGLLQGWVSPGGAVGELASYEMTLGVDNAPVDGYVAAPLVTRGALTGTAVQLGALTGTKRLWAALFVQAGTFTNLAVTIQSDTVGFPSPATAITFATVSASGGQFASVAGPLTDDYYRVSASIGSGTTPYAVLFGVM